MCGIEFQHKHTKKNQKHKFCSLACSNNFKKSQKIKLICPICNKDFYRKKSQVDKVKDKNNLTCSKQCCYILRKTLYAGNGNHQHGIKGQLNSSWQHDEVNKHGYKLIRVIGHPFTDKNDYIQEHRYVAEKHLLTKDFSINVNGELYLHPDCVVHHKDFNKLNNHIDNLYIFKNDSMHILFHNLIFNKVQTIEEFELYYKDKYENKILNYDWLYMAYVSFGISANKLSQHFNIPYKSIQKQIYLFDLEKEKQTKSLLPLLQQLDNFNKIKGDNI